MTTPHTANDAPSREPKLKLTPRQREVLKKLNGRDYLAYSFDYYGWVLSDGQRVHELTYRSLLRRGYIKPIMFWHPCPADNDYCISDAGRAALASQEARDE